MSGSPSLIPIPLFGKACLFTLPKTLDKRDQQSTTKKKRRSRSPDNILARRFRDNPISRAEQDFGQPWDFRKFLPDDLTRHVAYDRLPLLVIERIDQSTLCLCTSRREARHNVMIALAVRHNCRLAHHDCFLGAVTILGHLDSLVPRRCFRYVPDFLWYGQRELFLCVMEVRETWLSSWHSCQQASPPRP